MSDIYAIFGQQARKTHTRKRKHMRSDDQRSNNSSHQKEWKQFGFDRLEKQFQEALQEQKQRDKKHKKQKRENESTSSSKRSFTLDKTKYATILTAPRAQQQSLTFDRVAWSDGQQQVIDLVRQGKNVFFTGGAGCGKTYLMKYLIQWLQSQDYIVAVTALTGMAAFLINGVTIYAYLGLPKMAFERDADYMVSIILGSSKLKQRWTSLQVLFIDEISMVDFHLFGRLDYVARKVRNTFDQPFGGIQVIGCGDFYQLPPPIHTEPGAPLYAFENYSWDSTFPAQTSCIILRSTYRQRDEATIVMMNELRQGIVSQTTKTMLQHIIHRSTHSHKRNDGNGNQHRSLRLFCRRADVEIANQSELKRAMMYQGNKSIEYSEHWDFIENHVHDVWQQRKAELKKRKATPAQIRRVEQELALRVPKDTKRASMEQERTWRQSIRLCVGVRVRLLVNIDPSIGLMNGACGTVTGFQLSNHPHVSLMHLQYPLVQFDSGTSVLLKDYPWHAECQEGTLICWQLPIEYGYAMTIHKSQGQTLAEADIDLANVFERGQAYVAISRVQSLDHLRFTSYRPDVFDVDPRVKTFYDTIDPMVHAWNVLNTYLVFDLFRIVESYVF
jgi:ATP-dependent DNA helicase PIF1